MKARQNGKPARAPSGGYVGRGLTRTLPDERKQGEECSED